MARHFDISRSAEHIAWLCVGALWTLAAGTPALADDTELFVDHSGRSGAQPNILFILDNSGGMASQVLTQESFDGTTAYPAAGGCDATRVYWRTGTGMPPDCSTDRWFDLSALQCDRAVQAFLTVGHYTDNLAQYEPTAAGGGPRWEAIGARHKQRIVECRADRGVHGDGGNPLHTYARNGEPTAGYWGPASTEISWGATPVAETYTLYSGNYLAWAEGPTVLRTRLEVVREVATDLLESLDGVNVGLAYFNRNTDSSNDGGRIALAVADLGTTRSAIQATIDGLAPDGTTPLSETLYEAALYYSGGPVLFGDADRSVAASRVAADPSRYESPLHAECQKNFIVLLTDGEPTLDDAADRNIVELQDANGDSFSSLVGATCDTEVYPNGFAPSGGECLDDLAEFLHEGDFSPLPGRQNIATHTVGFTTDLPILADTAERGGGRYFAADDTATLANALTSIVTTILAEDTTLAPPIVTASSFNRTRHSSDVFISVFRPSGRTHWPGNLKKYRVRGSDAAIVDAQDNPAVDPATGFFAPTAQSFWSSVVDGHTADLGGAAALVPAGTDRVVYSHLRGTDLTSAANRIITTNSALTDELLGTGHAGEPTRAQVIDFINGLDAPDADHDGSMTEARRQMGDALHSEPVAVVYGPGASDGLVFAATNDGFLHAIDLDTGIEQWAFVPPELLGGQVALFQDEPSASKHYGIDADLRIQTVADNDGVIEAGEKVYLFFGVGRGGDFYYGLDVTQPLAPQLLWKLDGSTLPGLGQTWSAPAPTRVDVLGAMQNPDKLALVLGGGYEPDQDNLTLTTDTIGNSVYIVDSVSGALLWHGSRDGTHKDFNAQGRAMQYSIPGRVRVVDIDGDGFADRLYGGDMGGQVWRFDVRNGESAADLVSGGVIAQLGGAPAATPAPTDVRRFYNAPDVAFIEGRERNFVHIGIGSGHRGHPLSSTVEDSFYALRDYALGSMSQAQLDALTPVAHGDLVAITSPSPVVAADAPGWRIDLDGGEKVLSEARTFANRVIFSTFTPPTPHTSCAPQPGTNRTYAMSVYDGHPVLNLDSSVDSTTLTMDDLFIEADGGILPAPQALFLERDSDGDGIDDAADGATALVCVGLRCLSGLMRDEPIRTFWSQESVD